MRVYGTVQTSFWTDPKTAELSDGAKLLFLSFLTGPHAHMSGAFSAPLAYVAADLGWSLGTVRETVSELSSRGLVTVDEKSRWIVVHGFLKWNRPANVNCCRPIVDQLGMIPAKSPIGALLLAEITEHVDLSSKGKPEDVAKIEAKLSEYRNRIGTVPGTVAGTTENREQRAENREQGEKGLSRASTPEAGADAAPRADGATETIPPNPPVEKIPRAKKAAPASPAELEEFGRFWAIYPLRKAKPRALTVFCRLRRDGVSLDAILTGATVYAAERAGQEPKFTKYPEGWLNDGRWDDEPASPGGVVDMVEIARRRREARGGGMQGYSALDQAIEGIAWEPEERSL